MKVERLEIETNAKKLCGKSQKISRWAGYRLGMKLIKFIADNKISCIGLAAPQLGIFKRVFVLYDGNEYAMFINPKLIERGTMEDEQIEGCLSIPDEQYKIKRPTSITVKDIVRTKPFDLEGWTARAWLHEFDHLNGKLISDKGTLVDEVSTQKPL